MKGTPCILKFGVPRPFQFEAPSSWLSRLALAQGLSSIDELLRFLSLPTEVDLDWYLSGPALQDLLRRCNLPAHSFAIADRLMSSVLASGMGAKQFLLAGRKGIARFRYCPRCMSERRVGYLDIHWRFKVWLWCPIHNGLLLDACADCETMLEHPCLIEGTRAARAGHASLARCLRCCTALDADELQSLAEEAMKSLSSVERLWLINGRALLSALVHRSYQFRRQQHKLEGLVAMYASGVLPMAGLQDALDQKLRASRLARLSTQKDGLAELGKQADLQSVPSGSAQV
ncbi:TniQ family protein [Roseateles sp. P5_E11]